MRGKPRARYAVVRGITKSAFREEYAAFLAHLRATRKGAGPTQAELASRLGETQSWVSKVERGERRLDVMELRAFSNAMGSSLGEFIAELEAQIARSNGHAE